MNQSPVYSELKIVLSLRPVEVVNDVVHRNNRNCASCLRCLRGDVTEIDVVAATHTGQTISLTDVSVTNIVDHRRCNRPGVTKGHALGIVDQLGRWPLARKLLRPSRRILLQVSTSKDAILRRWNIIDTYDRCIQRLRIGRRERIQRFIQPIPSR